MNDMSPATPACGAFSLSGTQFTLAALHAGQFADAANVAYWMEYTTGGNVDFHRRDMDDQIHDLAALLGYRLVPVTK